MQINEIKEFIDDTNKKIISDEVKKEMLEKKIDELKNTISDANNSIELYTQTILLLNHAIQYARQQSKNIIENIVTLCLRYVFKTNIRFIIKDEMSQKSTGMEFYVTDENGNIDNLTKPEDSRGGGIVDVVSLGLRLSISEILTRNGILGPIILDEPAKYVSKEYIPNVGLYLKGFSDEYDRQIIMVTHDDYLSAIGDSCFELEQTDGVTKVVKTKNGVIEESTIEELVQPIVDARNIEIVDIEYVKEAGQFYLRIYLEKEGGITLDDCAEVSRELNPILDEKDPIKDNYFLEVSSPGLDRPLKKDKDFERYKGRDVEIKLYKPMNGSKQFEGELVGLTEDNNIKVIIDGEEVDFTRKEVALIRLAIKF